MPTYHFQGQEVSVLEMDGQFDKLEELIYVESHLSNTSAKFYGEGETSCSP
jgi:phosphoribulokinase